MRRLREKRAYGGYQANRRKKYTTITQEVYGEYNGLLPDALVLRTTIALAIVHRALERALRNIARNTDRL